MPDVVSGEPVVEFRIGRLRWDGIARLSIETVYLNLGANLAIMVDGRAVFSQDHWPVIELHNRLSSWQASGRTSDVVYDGDDLGHDDPPAIRATGNGMWAIGTESSIGVTVTDAGLDRAVSEFLARVAAGFQEETGIDLATWHQSQTDRLRAIRGPRDIWQR